MQNYYVGIDLHSTNSYIGIVDQDGTRIFNKRAPNDLSTIITTLKPFKEKIKGIAVESTFNWYWLVDGLMDQGYNLHLANVPAMKQYEGIKHTDDKSDAFWLAEMLRLKILPTGNIYPKEQRPMRDLLRRRLQLVHHRTALFMSMTSMIQNCTSINLSRYEKKTLTHHEITGLLDHPYQVMSANSIHNIIQEINENISNIEKEINKKVKVTQRYKRLTSVWGIGEILATTIMLETGDIRRFKDAGNYASYCRCVPTIKLSNGKTKGRGNKKCGNQYLAWAYLEAAYCMQRAYPEAKKRFQRKLNTKGRFVAIKALASKIARACYLIMKNNSEFDPSKLFA
jgi:transposase